MSVYIIKNTSAANIDILGITLSSNVYYTLNDAEIDDWRNDPEVMAYIADGTFIVNNGVEDISDPITAWNYFRGLTEPPKDDLGRWKIISDNPAKGKNKEIVINSNSIYLDSLGKYEEILKFKDNEKVFIEQIIVASPEIPYKFDFEYIKDFNGYKHKALPMSLENVKCLIVEQSAPQTSTTVVVSCFQGFDFPYIVVSGIYHVLNDDMKERLSANNVMSENGIEKEYAIKIINYDASARTITLEKPLDIDLKPNDKIAFAERSIVHLAGSNTTTNVKFSYTFEIATSGTSYLKIGLQNYSPSDAGEISYTIYGYKEIN